MITDQLYQEYLSLLLNGKRDACGRIVQTLIDENIDIKTLYTDLFQKSLYQVGELWEFNKITVAKEHLVTAITEGLLNIVYPTLFLGEKNHKKAVISCVANELHQIGGKMVADMFELQGWDAHFLGANMPLNQILHYIDESKPDLLGISLSVYFNMPSLIKGIEAIKANFENLDIVVGGQAFNWGGTDIVTSYTNTVCIRSLSELDHVITTK